MAGKTVQGTRVHCKHYVVLQYCRNLISRVVKLGVF